VDCWRKIDGVCELRTYADGDGAAAGEYLIWIEPYNRAVNGQIKGPPTKIPERYQNRDTSGLSVTIVDGDDTLPLLELKN
jgi:hypothetical protein